MQQSEAAAEDDGRDLDRHIKAIIDEISKTKQNAEAKYRAIKYDQVKPKTCKYKTPIMEDLYPKVELAE